MRRRDPEDEEAVVNFFAVTVAVAVAAAVAAAVAEYWITIMFDKVIGETMK